MLYHFLAGYDRVIHITLPIRKSANVTHIVRSGDAARSSLHSTHIPFLLPNFITVHLRRRYVPSIAFTFFCNMDVLSM